ncbi:MAG TPA: DMT family transporter [Xanthomonadales bacterium]|nr:DMT family transporter [Xanthomonadales bacterium]
MSLRDISLLVLVCLIWGFNFIAAAQGMQHFSPLVFMSLRFLTVLVVMLPFLRLPPTDQWARLIFVSLCIGAVHFTLLFWAIAISNNLSAIAILQQTYIPISVLLAMGFLGEQVGWRTLTAIAVAFAGVAVLSFDPLIFSQIEVLLLALLAAVAQAFGSVFMRGIKGVGALNFQAWTALLSLPVLISCSLLFESGQLEAIQTASWLDWASVSYSGLISSIVGYGLIFLLVQRNPVSTIMPYMLLMPVFAVLFGILIWGDRPGLNLFLGGGLVLSGILYISLRQRAKAPVAGN